MAPNTSVKERSSSTGSGERVASCPIAWKFRLTSIPATTPSAINPKFLNLPVI